MLKTTLALTLLATSVATQAANLTDSLFPCDSQFFSTLYQQKARLQQFAPMESDGHHHAWFKAPANDEATVWFAQPIRENHLTLAGYSLQTTDLEAANLGKYYYWGFLIEESPQVVMQQLRQVNWQQAGEDYIAVAMIRQNEKSDWQTNASAVSGIAPAKGSAEKLVMLSKSGSRSKLVCSVQGHVTPAVLTELRPDLAK